MFSTPFCIPCHSLSSFADLTPAQFYKQFFISLLQDVFVVLTDTLHKPGFPLHSSILAKMFSTIDKGLVTVPLWNEQEANYPNNQV